MRPRWTMERGTLWARELDGVSVDADTPSLTARIPATFDEVQAESAAELAAAMGVTDVESIRRRITTGRRCFAARVSGQIAAYGWLSRSRECVGEMEREIRIPANDVYIWDCATLPAYRQQRLYSALLHFMIRQMQAEGVRRVWIGTARSNQPSLQGFSNAGFHWAIYITYLRLLNLCFLWTSSSDTAAEDLILAARQMFTADHEHVWGRLAVGRQQSTRLRACVELEVAHEFRY